MYCIVYLSDQAHFAWSDKYNVYLVFEGLKVGNCYFYIDYFGDKYALFSVCIIIVRLKVGNSLLFPIRRYYTGKLCPF
jgi:hypothetical protein